MWLTIGLVFVLLLILGFGRSIERAVEEAEHKQ